MINLKKRLIFVFFIILLILISSCKGKKDVQKSLEEIRTGTEGIVMSFLPNAPPDKIHVEGDQNTFEVVLEVRNKGAYPQPNDITSEGIFGRVFLSGYDKDIITLKSKGTELFIRRDTLEGKSTINPNGGLDILTYEATVDTNKLNVEKYEPILLTTACYNYETVAGPSVCIDPNPYSTIKGKKVCEVQPVTLSNQGAPIAITRIDEEALALRTQFKITIKNVGGGDVLRKDKRNVCIGEGITREDTDKVMVDWVKISDKSLICGPFIEGQTKAEQGLTRLVNGEGFLICDLPKEQYKLSDTAFTTPLTIKLSYVYRNTAEKKIMIKKETSGVIGGEYAGGSSQIPTYYDPNSGFDIGGP